MAKREGFPAVIKSGRDLGKDGYRGCSPWARQGIFIFTKERAGQSESTPESKSPRPAVENRNQKSIHEFEGAGTYVCIHCCLLEEGHDRLMKKLRGEQIDAPRVRIQE
jgi:hypothetical protein